ncbi:MAG: hypothetical protein AABZ12_04570 [Planctomycetota bacterium]
MNRTHRADIRVPWASGTASAPKSSVADGAGRRTQRWMVGAAIASALVLPGCTVDVGSLFVQSGTALSVTVLDILLTDVANQVVDRLDGGATP